MPTRISQHLDLQIVFLNITSFSSVVAWVTEYATGFAGGFVLFTIGVLNLAKAYKEYKSINQKKTK